VTGAAHPTSVRTQPAPPIEDLRCALERRRSDGLVRVRRTVESAQGPRVRVDGRACVSFASNDYLGLAGDAAVAAALRDGLARWGAGAGASHLVCGHFAPHEALERELAAFVAPCDGARALLFSTGYLANLAVLSALAGRGDAIFADRRNHASLNDGMLLSRARFVRYAQPGAIALRTRLATIRARRKLIATDAVFSMDGDLAMLPQLLELAEAFDALLVVDDAHGFGVLGEGRGSVAHFALASERIVYMGTLGKAAGVAGAFVAAHPVIIETLLQTARPYIYTTAAPPVLACALRAALDRVREDAPRRARLFANMQRFRAGARALPWTLAPSPTAIQPLIIGPNAATLALSDALFERGLWVPAIRPPSVPQGSARLRISLSSAHSADDIDQLLSALHEIAQRGSR
jgi:8-amino-7-oxononanoate synthase